MSNHNVPVSFNFSGLLKKLNHTFTIEGMGGNWPATVTPATGLFIPKSKNESIETVLSFCATSGSCISGVDSLPYDPVNCTFDESEIFTFVRAKATLVDDPTFYVYSDSKKVVCSGCVKNPVAVIPTRLTLTSGTNNYGEFTGIVSGIIPNHKYSFAFRTLESNWPIYLENSTGVFSSPTDTYCIDSYVEFCEHTGVCLSGSKNVLDFQMPAICFSKPQDYEARIIADITSIECNELLTSSNIMNLSCKDCFPPSITVDIKSDNPIYLNSEQTGEFLTEITNLEPNKLYSYTIDSLYSNWPMFIHKNSGYIQTTETQYNLITSATFCATSAVCPTGCRGIINHTPDDQCVQTEYPATFNKYAILRVKLMDGECTGKQYLSQRMFVECNNCEDNTGISFVSVNVT